MKRKEQSRKLMESFLRMVNKYNAMEKYPLSFGTPHKFHHSERHLLDVVGRNQSMNISEFARFNGVTKGAVSQVVSRLEKKGALRRYKEAGNDKEVFIELTDTGREIYRHHRKTNDRTVAYIEKGLKGHTDAKVEFVATIFEWLEDYLDEGLERMELHARE